jgi:hypothetical protein
MYQKRYEIARNCRNIIIPCLNYYFILFIIGYFIILEEKIWTEFKILINNVIYIM